MSKTPPLESMMQPKVFLHDLRRTKNLTGINAETYKNFVSFMKSRNIPITLPNLLQLLEDFSKKYGSQKLQSKFSKDIETLSSTQFKEDMFDLVKNSALTFGVSIYYLIKSNDIISNFKTNFNLKVGVIVLSILIIIGVFLYFYYSSKNRNYYQEVIKNTNNLYDELIYNKEQNDYNIEQIIVSYSGRELYTPLTLVMLNALNDSDGVHDNSIELKEILQENILQKDNMYDNDEEEIIEIQLSPHEDKEDSTQIDVPLENFDEVLSDKIEKIEKVEKVEKSEKEELHETTIEEEPKEEPEPELKEIQKSEQEESEPEEKPEPKKRGRKAKVEPKKVNKKNTKQSVKGTKKK